MEHFVFITASREEYNPKAAAGGSMTVDELIDLLRGYPADEKVVVSNDSGYSFGSLDSMRVTEGTYNEETGVELF